MTRRRSLILTVVAVLSAILFVLPAGATPIENAVPLEATLDQLSEILQHIEGQLSAMEAPRIERLEDGMEKLIELIESLLDEFNRPRVSDSDGSIKARVLRLDKALHQLIEVLEHVVDADEPDHTRMRGAIGDLGRWVDGYVAGLTAGLDPQTADRLEAAAHEMVRDLALRIADLAREAHDDESDHPRLELLLHRLQDLTQRLEFWIRQKSSASPNRTF